MFSQFCKSWVLNKKIQSIIKIKTIFFKFTSKYFILQLESKVKSCEQIELLESTIRTLKNQIKEQKLNFAEKFEPTNEVAVY